jgi:hypothetical protein
MRLDVCCEQHRQLLLGKGHAKTHPAMAKTNLRHPFRMFPATCGLAKKKEQNLVVLRVVGPAFFSLSESNKSLAHVLGNGARHPKPFAVVINTP